MTDLAFRTATDVAAAIAAGELTSAEVTRTVLDRIDALDGRVNAVTERRADAAEREAAAADADRAAGRTAGPLHGVPMTVKEALDVAGLPTTWGVPGDGAVAGPVAGPVADTDATVVRRLRDAGAVVVGQTNVAPMLADVGQSDNPVYGRTGNPWDLDRAPGGSSGGAAAAVAAGFSYLEYGSDLAGSVRVPASMCGVYGLKPTAGLVPLTGFRAPGPPAPPSPFDHISSLGPLARSAADVRTALRVTGGPDGAAGSAYRWTLPAPRHDALAGYRVGVLLDDPTVPVTGEVGAVLSDLVDALAGRVATVVRGWPEGVDPEESNRAFGFQAGAFLALASGEAPDWTGADLLDENRRREALRAAWDAYFADVDVLLCPTVFTTAVPHDDRPYPDRTIATSAGERSYFDLGGWITHASAAGLPALSAPAGRATDGLPVGVQVIGPRYEDDTVLTFAERLAEVAGGYEAPTGV